MWAQISHKCNTTCNAILQFKMNARLLFTDPNKLSSQQTQVNSCSAGTRWSLRMKLHQGPDCLRTSWHRQIYRPMPRCSRLILTIQAIHPSSCRWPTAVSLVKTPVSDITMNQTSSSTWPPEKQLSQLTPCYLSESRVTLFPLSSYTNSKWWTHCKTTLTFWCTRLQKIFNSKRRLKFRIRFSQTKMTSIDKESWSRDKSIARY